MAGTAKGRALGSALRKARLHRGLSLRKLAQQINRQPGVLSTWETGTYTPKPEQVSQILTALGVSGDEFDEIVALAYDNDAPLWVATSLPEQRQQMAAVLDFEQHAATVTQASPLLVPGLLQTSDYTRAMMVAARIPAGEVATRVAVRIGRQDVLTRPNPLRFVAIVCQQALTHVIGDRTVMAEQLGHILEMARRPNVTVRLIRPDSGWHPALEGPFYLIDFPDTTSLVHLENRRSGLFLHKAEDVAVYRHAIDLLLKVSFGEEDTLRIIREIRERMGTSTHV